jgi:hypothetical protein
MKYFVYNLMNQNMQMLDSEEALIRWFAGRNSSVFWSKKKTNSLFDEIAMNWNDTKTHAVWDQNHSHYVMKKEPRTLMVFDEYDRIIDPRKFKDQILNYEFSYGNFRYRRYGEYEFRRGPVPGIHRRTYHRSSYYRRVKTTQERRIAVDRQIRSYIRGRRNFRSLPSSWDEIPREIDHSWKAKKIKKQWMKHLK